MKGKEKGKEKEKGLHDLTKGFGLKQFVLLVCGEH